MRETTENWAEFGDCNVCIVEWSRLAHFSYRITAKKHLKMVADASVQFMRFLIEHGMDIEHVSLAADSLAAHLAALIGQSFEGKLEAIYGIKSPFFVLCEKIHFILNKPTISIKFSSF